MADTVLLNATRSEAATLLEEPPPRPAPLLQDSVEGLPLGRGAKGGFQAEIDALRAVGELRQEGGAPEERGGAAAASKQHPPRLWAPPSRGAVAGAALAQQGANGVPGRARPADGGPPATDSARHEHPPRYQDEDLDHLLTPAGTGPTVVEGRMLSAGEAGAEAREGDVRAAFAGLPKIKPHWTHRYMKLLLVGEDGLGRTTFTRNLFAAYARDASFPINDASVPNARRIFRDNPEALCTEIVLQDSDNKVYYHYLVQDTPGYGDSDDLAGDRQMVLDYISDCSDAYLEQEQDPDRRAAMHAIRDTRVDACLYFIPPHRLRQIDLQFLSDLAARVPVVPVLAKADTMTGEELKEFRHKVRAALHKAGVHSPFSRDALEDAGSRHCAGPFAVIGSNTMDLEVGRFWPVRKYPWGSVEAMLTQHSDLPVLRRLLFEAGYCELKDATEARFHDYRHDHCGGGVRGGLKGALAGTARLLMLGGGLALAGWLMISGAPLLKDEVKRKETVRRVKAKVEEVVESAVDAVHEVGEKAHEAAAITKSTTAAAADVTKQAINGAARKAGTALESKEARRKREAAEEPRSSYKRKPWWQFWGE